jgi:quercetin dioxygenase-like cupin family protein
MTTEILEPKILENLIAYQNGSVVSKTLVSKKAGTVTLFAFDEGQGLSEHTAPYDALVLALDGEVQITVDGKQNILKTGEVILLPANRPHAVKAIVMFKMLLIMIREK